MRAKMVVYGIAVVLIVLAAGSLIAVHVIFSTMFFGRAEKSENSQWPSYQDFPGYDRQLVKFKSGKNWLQGYVYGGENSAALVVISHGLGSSAEGYISETIWFVDHGYRVFTYDCTGTYASEGRGTKGMAQSKLDLDAALRFIETDESFGGLPVLLYGHSWGAYAAAAVLDLGHDVTAAVCVSGYDTPLGILYETSKRIIGPMAGPAYPFMGLDNFFRFGRDAGVSAVQGINASGLPVLIVHGIADKTVLYNGSSIISRRDKITNPHVEYFIRDQPGQNGHTDLYLSAEAVAYAASPHTDGAEIDRRKMGELDEAFMNKVNDFYKKYL